MIFQLKSSIAILRWRFMILRPIVDLSNLDESSYSLHLLWFARLSYFTSVHFEFDFRICSWLLSSIERAYEQLRYLPQARIAASKARTSDFPHVICEPEKADLLKVAEALGLGQNGACVVLRASSIFMLQRQSGPARVCPSLAMTPCLDHEHTTPPLESRRSPSSRH